MEKRELPEVQISHLVTQLTSLWASFLASRNVNLARRSQFEEKLMQHLTHLWTWANNSDSVLAKKAGLSSDTSPMPLIDINRSSSNNSLPDDEILEDKLMLLKKHILITGESGAGKSALLKRFAKNLLLSHKGFD
ncbi:MAG: ATP-binding protein, partial [Chitinophagaceae bacterium]